MKLKFLIDYKEIGLSYNHKTGKCSIGGNKKNINEINSLLVNFYINGLKKNVLQKNKIRYDFYVSLEKFNEILLKLENLGFAFEEVRSLKRLMR